MIRDHPDDPLDPMMLAHYALGLEEARLSGGAGRLEMLRTRDILGRWLPPPPARILDVGGGPGAYAFWLAGLGHRVTLVDAVPLHVEQALRTAALQPGRLEGAVVGDARRLAHADASCDAALLMGPLYHLTERSDRIAALREARRVTRPGGIVVAAAISRFASTLDGLARGFLDDPVFERIARADLRCGQHRNPTDNPFWFTTAFFHHPDELRDEMAEAGLGPQALVAVEGPAWLLGDLDARLADDARRHRLMEILALIESEPALIGASAHILAMGRAAGAS